jgi:hypothetical protein
MQRKDLELWLYQHTARQLLQHTTQLINRRAELGRTTRLINLKVKAYRFESLNEAADALAAAAAELEPTRAVELDLVPEAMHFRFKGKWVEWDAQRAAEQCVSRALWTKVRASEPGGGTAYPAPHYILAVPT